jgi:hypothetical protein
MKIQIDAKELERLYIIERKSTTEIAKIFGCGKSTIANRLSKLGLSVGQGNRNPKRKDMTGEIFGSLEVVGFSHLSKSRSVYWLCKCKCGNTKPIPRQSLIKGRNITCGCHCNRYADGSSNWKGHGKISGHYWRTIQSCAKRRNIDVDITSEQIWELYLKQNGKCALTGIDIDFEDKFHNRRNRTASLDRRDSTKGYTLDNIQWVHKDINQMKMEFSEEKLLQYCKLIVEHNATK